MHRQPRRWTASLGQALGGLTFALVLLLAWPAWAQDRLERPASPGPSGPVGPEAIDFGPLGPAHDAWDWQPAPDGLIYHSYLAGVKEPRFAAQWTHDRHWGWIWDIALGGRVGLMRYGTRDARQPEGWQLDMEGAVFPRLNLLESLDLMAADYRIGFPLTCGWERFQTKFAFYHVSSHLGDEMMLKHPEVPRINYSRNALAWGNSFYWNPDLRLYAEMAWAFHSDGGSKPGEFQFGVDYVPRREDPKATVPFFAVNGHLREDVGYGGNLVVQTGWLWRGVTGHLLRAGVHYFIGQSDQYEFFRQYEHKIGLGLWYDY